MTSEKPGAGAETADGAEDPVPDREATGDAPDPRRATRERVERALSRGGSGVRPVPGSKARRTPASREGDGPEHWSRTIRKRVSEGGPKEPSAPADAGAEAADGGKTAPAPDPDAVRERVRRRLQEAEDRRVALDAAFEPAVRPVRAAPAEDSTRTAAAEGPGTGEADAWAGGWAGEGEAPRPESAPEARRSASRLAALIATCGFLGRVPFAPGTAGAAAGLLVFFLARNLPGATPLFLFLAAAVVGTWAAGRHARDLGKKDPQVVVVDEFCGMWLSLLAADPPLPVALIAFAAFRVLDILKPPPLRQVERLPGGIGIMADDLLAGGVVRLALFLVLGL